MEHLSSVSTQIWDAHGKGRKTSLSSAVLSSQMLQSMVTSFGGTWMLTRPRWLPHRGRNATGTISTGYVRLGHGQALFHPAAPTLARS